MNKGSEIKEMEVLGEMHESIHTHVHVIKSPVPLQTQSEYNNTQMYIKQ